MIREYEKLYPKDDSDGAAWALFAGIGWGTVFAIQSVVQKGLEEGTSSNDIIFDILEILDR